jgi:hypothetical protein
MSTGCKVILDGENRDTEAAFMEGPKGKIYPGLRSDIENLRRKIDELPDPPAEITDFHESVRTRKNFALDERKSFWSSTLVNMGVTAHRLNRNLRFDSKTLKFDDPEANAYNNPEFRAPWKL